MEQILTAVLGMDDVSKPSSWKTAFMYSSVLSPGPIFFSNICMKSITACNTMRVRQDQQRKQGSDNIKSAHQLFAQSIHMCALKPVAAVRYVRNFCVYLNVASVHDPS
jgi:hypothetical protein